MTWIPYDSHLLRQHNGNAIDWDSDDIRLSVHTASYVPNRATHDFFDDVTNEVTGGNYSAGGVSVGTVTLAMASNILTGDCPDISFAAHASGFSNGRILVLRKNTGVAGTSPLIAYYDMGSDKGNVGADLLLQTPNGIFKQQSS